MLMDIMVVVSYEDIFEPLEGLVMFSMLWGKKISQRLQIAFTAHLASL